MSNFDGHPDLHRREAVHHPGPCQDDQEEPEHQDVSAERHEDAGGAELHQGQEGEGENWINTAQDPLDQVQTASTSTSARVKQSSIVIFHLVH